MPELIEAECPNCGATLELPTDENKAFCTHCGAKFIIAKDEVYDLITKDETPCPMCHGTGSTGCLGIEHFMVKGRFRSYEIFAEACIGDGRCLVYCHPPKNENISNHCRNGKCVWCGGTGGSLGNCRFCEGTGNCRFCNGTGICKFCGGKGVITCRRCNGTGLMV